MDGLVEKHSKCTHIEAVAELRKIIAAWKNQEEIFDEQSSGSQCIIEDFDGAVQKNESSTVTKSDDDRALCNASEHSENEASNESENLETQERGVQSIMVSENFNFVTNELETCNSLASTSERNCDLSFKNHENSINLTNHKSDFQVELVTDQNLSRPSTSGHVETLTKDISCLGSKQYRSRKSNRAKNNKIARKIIHSYFVREMVLHNDNTTLRTTEILGGAEIHYKNRIDLAETMFRPTKTNRKLRKSHPKINYYEVEEVDNVQCSMSSIRETPNQNCIQRLKGLPDAGKSCSSLVPATSNNIQPAVEEECFAQRNSPAQEETIGIELFPIIELVSSVFSGNEGVLQMVASSTTETFSDNNKKLEVNCPNSTGVNCEKLEEKIEDKDNTVEDQADYSLNSAIQVGEITSNGRNIKENDNKLNNILLDDTSRKLPKNISLFHEDPFDFHIDKDVPSARNEVLKSIFEISKENVSESELDEVAENVIPTTALQGAIQKACTSFNNREKKRITKIIPRKLKAIPKNEAKRSSPSLEVSADKKSPTTAKCNKLSRPAEKRGTNKKQKLHLLKKILHHKHKNATKMPKLNVSKSNLSRLNTKKSPTMTKSKVSKLIRTSNYAIPDSIEIINMTKGEVNEAYGRADVTLTNVKKNTSKILIDEKAAKKFYSPKELEYGKVMELKLIPDVSTTSEARGNTYKSKIQTKPVKVETVVRGNLSNNNLNSPRVPCHIQLHKLIFPDKLEESDKKKECPSKNTRLLRSIKASNYSIPVSIEIVSSTLNPTKELENRKLVQSVIPRYYPYLPKTNNSRKQNEDIRTSVNRSVSSKVPTNERVNIKKRLSRFEELEVSITKIQKSFQKEKNYNTANICCDEQKHIQEHTNLPIVNRINENKTSKLDMKQQKSAVPYYSEDKQENDCQKLDENKTCTENELRSVVNKDTSKCKKHVENLENQSPIVVTVNPETGTINENIRNSIVNNTIAPKTSKEMTHPFEIDLPNEISIFEVNANGANTSSAIKIGENECIEQDAQQITSIDNDAGGKYDFIQNDIIPSSPSLFSDDGNYDESLLAISLDENVGDQTNDNFFDEDEIEEIFKKIDCWSDDSLN